MPDISVLSISQLNRYVKSLLEGDLYLSSVTVCGEISNFVNHRSGHFYFSLKDEGAEIKACMFRSANAKLRFVPENGMKVVCKGKVTLYEAGGQYQIVVDEMFPDGIGELTVAFEQLKAKLQKKGYFDTEHKKPIPEYPKRVGVITSPTGAAVRDITNVLSRRWPLAEMVFYPVLVQGEGAAADISHAIYEMNSLCAADVLIVGRGGGSIEDLWAFNEETVADAVFRSNIPVISAVGHETDFTICDFVADLRAPTPSAAAELAVPDIVEKKRFVSSLHSSMNDLYYSSVILHRSHCGELLAALGQYSPSAYIQHLRQRCDMASLSLTHLTRNAVNDSKQNLVSVCAQLDALSPLKILMRGYSYVSKGDKSIASAASLETGDDISVRFSDGTVNCTVKGKE